MKLFESPEIEIKKFEIMDIISSSDGNIGGVGGYDNEDDL